MNNHYRASRYNNVMLCVSFFSDTHVPIPCMHNLDYEPTVQSVSLKPDQSSGPRQKLS